MKKPSRKVKGASRTKLVICEGISDKKFMERIKELFHIRNCGFTVRLDEAAGGGPKSAIFAAINYQGDYDKKYVFIDSDLPIPQDALTAANRRNITIIQSTPFCIEGFLLKFTGHSGQVRDTQHAKNTLYRRDALPDVVTQAWYERFITQVSVDAILNQQAHCCYNVLNSSVSLFKIY